MLKELKIKVNKKVDKYIRNDKVENIEILGFSNYSNQQLVKGEAMLRF